jgi:curved DNA-binding protein CbpA
MQEELTVNYYALLELSPAASAAEIKKAWHEQVQVWHPDRFIHAPALHQKAEARAQLINQAYQTLSDPTARKRYDATTEAASSPTPAQPSDPSRPHPTPRARQEPRGPRTLITLARQDHPLLTVPPIHLLVDSQEPRPYTFHGLLRIAGIIRQALPAGDYAIAEAPALLCVKRTRAEELYTTLSNPSDRRPPFLHALNQLLAFPHRFLVIEGPIQHSKVGARRLSLYHTHRLLDFLDAITARYGIQIVFSATREEAEERIANLAAMHYADFLAQQQGLGRFLHEDEV